MWTDKFTKGLIHEKANNSQHYCKESEALFKVKSKGANIRLTLKDKTKVILFNPAGQLHTYTSTIALETYICSILRCDMQNIPFL